MFNTQAQIAIEKNLMYTFDSTLPESAEKEES